MIRNFFGLRAFAGRFAFNRLPAVGLEDDGISFGWKEVEGRAGGGWTWGRVAKELKRLRGVRLDIAPPVLRNCISATWKFSTPQDRIGPIRPAEWAGGAQFLQLLAAIATIVARVSGGPRDARKAIAGESPDWEDR